MKKLKIRRVGTWVHCEWWRWPSECLVFKGTTSNAFFDSDMCFAAIRLRECPDVGHTKAEGVELEGVYPAGGNWRYHQIKCYIAYNPIYLFPTYLGPIEPTLSCTISIGRSSTGCNWGPLNLLDCLTAILTASLCRMGCCPNLRLTTKSRVSDIGE